MQTITNIVKQKEAKADLSKACNLWKEGIDNHRKEPLTGAPSRLIQVKLCVHAAYSAQ